GIERPRTYANRPVRKRPQRAVDVRRTVQSRPDGDVERLVENAAQLRCRNGLTAEAQGTDAPGHVVMAEHLVTADLLQPPPEPVRQRDLMFTDVVESLFLHVLHSRSQPGDAEHIGGAAFEEVRKLARLRLAGRVTAGAALTPGPQRRPRADVQRPGARRAKQ